MTPLARKLTEELLKPVIERRLILAEEFLRYFRQGIHCFEVTGIKPLIPLIADKIFKDGAPSSLAFLPSGDEHTWIEFVENGDRLAYLLAHQENGDALLFMCAEYNGIAKMPRRIGKVLLARNPDDRNIDLRRLHATGVTPANKRRAEIMPANIAMMYPLLACINSPRVICRVERSIHRAFARRLLRQKQMIGKFPLRGFTEIKLEVHPPEYLDDVPAGQLSGRKCLHFVRRHIRYRNGRVEWVREHWRGDGALGIKQTRYRVTPTTGTPDDVRHLTS